MTRPLALALLFLGCGPAAAPRAPDPIAVGDPSEPELTREMDEASTEGPALPALERSLAPQHDQIYELARHGRHLFLGAQGGASVIDVPTGQRVAAYDEFICNAAVVVANEFWTGCDKHVLRWSPQRGWREYLANDENDADYYDLLVDPQGQLLVAYGSQQWRYDAGTDTFESTPSTFGGSYHAVFHEGELWSIDFMNGIRHGSSLIPVSSPVYPVRDPRRLSIDSQGRLYAEDFGAGIFRWDGQRFLQVHGITAKGTGVAYDAARNRAWLLHYTDGLTVTIDDQVVKTIDLSDLTYMRRMLLESDGSVWVAGWPGLVRIRWDGGDPVREDIL